MSQNSNQPDLRVFDTGAVRTKDADGERYDLITPIGLEGVARIYAEGARKYGDTLWERGMPISDLVNHALRHWRLYASGDRSEDHLSKCAWGFLAAKHSEVLWPHLNLDLRREGCIPPTVDDETAASWKNLAANLESMKRDVKEAAKAPVAGVEIKEGDLVHIYPGGRLRVVRPSLKPVRYHFLADPADRLRMAAYRSDLQWEGHEVVSRWIDSPALEDGQGHFDFQSCDVAVVFARPGSLAVRSFIDGARRFSKPAVVIGERQDGFPARGTGERYFPDWESFLRAVAEESRPASKQAPARR